MTSGGYLTATDLAGFLGCRHLPSLEAAVKMGMIVRPASAGARLDALRERGQRHEREYLTQLQATGPHPIVELTPGAPRQERVVREHDVAVFPA